MFAGRYTYESRKAQKTNAIPTSLPFWFKRKSHFRLLLITIFISDSHVFSIPTI